MQFLGPSWLLLGSATALAPSNSVPPQAASSALSNAINYNIPGASSPDSLRHGGNWHWGPGHGHPGRPGWGQHPHGPGNCIQIQNKFPRGTNGPGSESGSRAEAVKVCDVATLLRQVDKRLTERSNVASLR